MNDRTDTLLIKGGLVFRHGADPHHPEAADILVEGSRIAKIEPGLASTEAGDVGAANTIDARGKLVIPGFVNAHFHSHDVLLKGCFDVIPQDMWVINALPPAYPMRSAEEVRARTLLGAVECLHTGTTTVQDMLTIFPFSEEHLDVVLEAYESIGIRVVFGMQIGDVSGLDRVPYWREVVPEEYHKYLGAYVEPYGDAKPLDVAFEQFQRHRAFSDRVTWALTPTNPQLCSRDMLEAVADLSAANGLPVLTHIYEGKSMTVASRDLYREFDGSPIKYLQALGLLGPHLGLAHGVWMGAEEIELLAATGTGVNLLPTSNLKIKAGVAPIRDYIEAGVTLGLGCDNCSCGDAQNPFYAMKLMTGLAAVSHPDPGPPTAVDAFHAATMGGARSLGLEGEIGDISPGMKADMAILDLANVNFVPLNSVVRQLVYGETGQSVETVIVDGRVVMHERRLLTIDEDEVREAVNAVMPGLMKDFRDVSARVEEMTPYLLEAWRRMQGRDVGLHRFVGKAGAWRDLA